jgi:hypothetical protein
MELKSLVNEEAEMLGAAPLDELALALPEDELLELEDDELPQAAMNAAIASAGTRTRSQRGMKGTLLSLKTPYRMPSVSESSSRRLPAGAKTPSHMAAVVSTGLNQK